MISTDDEVLVLVDSHFADGSDRQKTPIDLPMETLFGKPPKMLREVESVDRDAPELDFSSVSGT